MNRTQPAGEERFGDLPLPLVAVDIGDAAGLLERQITRVNSSAEPGIERAYQAFVVMNRPRRDACAPGQFLLGYAVGPAV